MNVDKVEDDVEYARKEEREEEGGAGEVDWVRSDSRTEGERGRREQETYGYAERRNGVQR